MKKILTIIFIFSLLIALPISVSALGQVTQPINITNAMRGEKIHQELIAVNSEDKVIAIEFTSAGKIKDWVKFYKPNDLKNPISTTTLGAKSNLTMTAIFLIPSDIPNGEYKGVVSVTKAPEQSLSKEQTQTSIAQKIDRAVTIKVSDQENINLAASVIPKTYDLKPGDPLSIRIIYDNQSNISLRPSINFKIKTNDKTLYNVIYPYPEGEPDVNPKAIYEIPVMDIPLMNIANGEYLAQLEFMRGDKSILESHFVFSIGTQNAFITGNAADFMKNNLNWLLWLIAFILLAVAVLLVNKNIKIRQGLKKKILKIFNFVRAGIASLF